MIIRIPVLPGRELNPNYKGHWSRQAKAAREFRESAGWCAKAELQKWLQGHEKAELSVTLVIRDRRGYKDLDNALASLKPAIDGCVDAGVIPDDDDEHLSYRLPILYQIDKEHSPLTILEFKEIK